MKNTLFLLLIVSINTQSMIVPDLVSLCSKKITQEIERGVTEEQLDLLAHTIDAQFPPEKLTKYVAWLNVPPENQFDLSMAISTLNKASEVFIETDVLHITPASIRIKRALPEGLIQKFYWEALEEKLAEKMYHKSAVIKKCVDFYSSKISSWDMVHLTAGVNGMHIPVNFEILADQISNNVAREKRAAEIAKEHACKSRRITRYDEWCP